MVRAKKGGRRSFGDVLLAGHECEAGRSLLGRCAGWWQVSGLIFGDIDLLPIAAHDTFANLCGGLALAGLFVGVEGFALADVTARAVMAHEAIQQAAVTLTTVAMAVAGLLIEDLFNAAGDGVGVEDNGFRKQRRLHG